MGNTPQAEKGLLSLTAKIAGESQVFSPTKRGPYKDGDVIEFKFPSPIEDPVDLSKVNLIVSLENDCFVQPGLPGTIDLTSPFELKVKTAIGVVKTYIIKAIPVGPIATFKKGWLRTVTIWIIYGLFGFHLLPYLIMTLCYMTVWKTMMKVILKFTVRKMLT